MTREEAIEKVRQMSLPKETMEILEALAPELRESEDERIRKELIGMVKFHCADEHLGRYLNWLEKQKEQKHYWKPTETDVALFNKAVTTNKALTPTERAQLDIIRSKFGYCRAVNCSGIVQKEQKPAEWSEEDQLNLNWVIAILNGEPCNLDIQLESLISWLKSLRPSWKPSDEQLEALEKTTRLANFGSDAKRRDALLSLYEQLKKLMLNL